jgi:glycosyltransferase involved in cell wall biosynthesis
MNISVVIPAYNSAAYIGETIDSARNQTQPPFEIIVVDDGSSDDTATVAARHGARVVRQKNAGVCAARNTGILTACGDWIALLDHDDVWEPRKLERQAAAVAARPDVACVATDFVRQHGTVVDLTPCLGDPAYHFDRLRAERVDETVVVCPDAAVEMLDTGWFLFPSAMLIRRDVLIDVGMFRPEQRLCEDVDCFLRVLHRTALAVVREPLWRWREHAGNNSRNSTGIQEGWLRLGEFVRTEPQRYARGTWERMQPMLRTTRRSLMALYTSEGDFDRARRVSRSAFGSGLTPTDAALAVVVALPPPFLALVRRARSALRAFSLQL